MGLALQYFRRDAGRSFMFHIHHKDMKIVWFIGIDVSKATLDVAICQGENTLETLSNISFHFVN